MKKYLFILIATFTFHTTFAQKFIDIVNDDDTISYTSDLVLHKNEAYNLIVTENPIKFWNNRLKGFILQQIVDDKLQKQLKVYLPNDTLLNACKLLIDKDSNLLVLGSYLQPEDSSKGIFVYYINTLNMEIAKKKYYPLEDYKIILGIPDRAINGIIKDNCIYGYFNADTTTDFIQKLTGRLCTTLFKLNLDNDSLLSNNLNYQFTRGEFYHDGNNANINIISISDTLFAWYLNAEIAGSMGGGSVSNVTYLFHFDNHIQIQDTTQFTAVNWLDIPYLDGPFDKNISALKINNNIYIASTTNFAFKLVPPFIQKTKATLLKIKAIDNEPVSRKYFYNLALDSINDKDTNGYRVEYNTAYNNSLSATANDKMVFVYTNNYSPNIDPYYLLYIAMVDTQLNTIASKQIQIESRRELEIASVQCNNNNECYVSGTQMGIYNRIKDGYFNKSFVLKIALKDLTTSSNEIKIQSNNSFVIYPNPFKQNLVIENTLGKNVRVYFYSITGQLLQTENIDSHTQQIEMEPICNGFVFYRIVSLDNELLQSGKLIKE